VKINNKQFPVHNLTTPILVTLKNIETNLKTKTMNFIMPGKIKYYLLKKTSVSCNLLVAITKLTEQVVGNVTLNLYLRLGDYPTLTEHDYHMSIQYRPTGEAVSDDESNDATLHFKKIDVSSFLVSNISGLLKEKEQPLTGSRDGNGSTMANETIVYFGLTYEGLMPPLRIFNNPFTYDTLDKRGEYVFNLTTSCTECRFWNVSSLQWMTEGLAVSY